jgi:hypothetical protein
MLFQVDLKELKITIIANITIIVVSFVAIQVAFMDLTN